MSIKKLNITNTLQYPLDSILEFWTKCPNFKKLAI